MAPIMMKPGRVSAWVSALSRASSSSVCRMPSRIRKLQLRTGSRVKTPVCSARERIRVG